MNLFTVMYNYYRTPKQKTIDVSIIIPSFLPEQLFLEECFNSLLEQKKCKNIKTEIILILNGKKEPYISNILSFMKKNISRLSCDVFVLYTSKQGVSTARNIGLNFSRGNYICFLDDDDYLSDYYIYELYTLAKKGYIGLANMIDFNINKKYKESYFSNKFKKYQKANNINIYNVRSWFSVTVLKIIPKEMIGKIRFHEGLSNSEDALFMFDIAYKNMSFSFTSEKAIYYRRVTENGLVATFKKKSKIEQFLYGVKLFYLFTIHYINSGFRQGFIFYCTRVIAPFKQMLK